MRILMGQAQRERILKYIKPGMHILEWGSGGSTLWFADRLPDGASLTSIEHDRDWYSRVRRCIGERSNVQLLLCEPTGPVGVNATIEEENPSSLENYINAVSSTKFDVIIVDGVARVSCMERAQVMLKPGGTVFLHDAHRDWYDEGKSLFIEHGTIGSCSDYPGPLLWWGGLEPEHARYSKAAIPIIVNCYTSETLYEEEANGLRLSLERLGLEYEIVGVPDQGSWEKNCAFKAQFIHDVYYRLNRPVLWLDADARVCELPILVAGAEADFAIGKVNGWQFASGTMYFNSSPLGELLLKTWLKYCKKNPDIWDQIHLDRAWEEISAQHPLYTQWLPQTYIKIFDMPWESRLIRSGNKVQSVIEHFQASRRYKEDKAHLDMIGPSEELVNSRKACRPRNNWYDDRYVLRSVSPSPDQWATPLKKRFSLWRKR
jgi:hypothetical protein